MVSRQRVNIDDRDSDAGGGRGRGTRLGVPPRMADGVSEVSLAGIPLETANVVQLLAMGGDVLQDLKVFRRHVGAVLVREVAELLEVGDEVLEGGLNLLVGDLLGGLFVDLESLIQVLLDIFFCRYWSRD